MLATRSEQRGTDQDQRTDNQRASKQPGAPTMRFSRHGVPYSFFKIHRSLIATHEATPVGSCQIGKNTSEAERQMADAPCSPVRLFTTSRRS